MTSVKVKAAPFGPSVVCVSCLSSVRPIGESDSWRFPHFSGSNNVNRMESTNQTTVLRFITARIQRMGKVMFSLCLSVPRVGHSGSLVPGHFAGGRGGVPLVTGSRSFAKGRGVPLVSSGGGGIPVRSLLGQGVSQSGPFWGRGYPSQVLDRGSPLPPRGRARTGYHPHL